MCRVLDQAQRWGWVAVNVGRDARPPRQTGSNPKPVPVDVMLTMLDAADGANPTLAMLIVVAADTGARRGELCALRWRHVDFEARTVRIEAAIGETNVTYEKDTKNHQHRTVTLSEFGVEWLHEHWARHTKACALCGTELSDDAYALASEPGGLTPWHPSGSEPGVLLQPGEPPGLARSGRTPPATTTAQNTPSDPPRPPYACRDRPSHPRRRSEGRGDTPHGGRLGRPRGHPRAVQATPRRAEPPPLTDPPASPPPGAGIVVGVSDRPFISVDELELMTPDERLAAVRDRVVTDLDELPDDFRRRIIATAQSLSDGPLAG